MERILVHGVEELEKAATALLNYAGTTRQIAFFATMGTGKTTFIKEICRQLGTEDLVNSPTYTLVNEYAGKQKIYHFDLYRLEDIEEAFDIGFEEYIEEGVFCLIEWPEIIVSLLDNYVKVEMNILADGSREIVFSHSQTNSV